MKQLAARPHLRKATRSQPMTGFREPSAFSFPELRLETRTPFPLSLAVSREHSMLAYSPMRDKLRGTTPFQCGRARPQAPHLMLPSVPPLPGEQWFGPDPPRCQPDKIGKQALMPDFQGSRQITVQEHLQSERGVAAAALAATTQRVFAGPIHGQNDTLIRVLCLIQGIKNCIGVGTLQCFQ
jgi:hypothetical protein